MSDTEAKDLLAALDSVQEVKIGDVVKGEVLAFDDSKQAIVGIENAGVEGSVIINQLKNEQPGIGYNAAEDKFEDMVAAGIVDPTKVTRSALQNAASVSALLLTTEAVVADKPEPKEAAPMNPAAGAGMGGMM